MSENNKNIIESQDALFTPVEDMQIVMKNGLPSAVIVPMEEFDRMTATIALAEQLLEGKQFDLANGQKGSFQELADERVAEDRAAYEAELAAMFDACDEDEDCDDEDCDDEDCDDEESCNS